MSKLPRIITKTLSFRLSLTVIAALATLLLVALLIIFVFSRKAVKEEALHDAGQTLEATMQRIDNILLKVEQSSGNIYWKLLSHIHQPEKLEHPTSPIAPSRGIPTPTPQTPSSLDGSTPKRKMPMPSPPSVCQYSTDEGKWE